ncbi:30S ribosomal protein S6 [Patescibacteria group bacterium]|nr:MAG: 30S ribosomal protein S6 [Patescibacteria group bacterium]
MKFYEFLYILPSKYAENEIDPVVKAVTEMTQKAGAEVVKTTVLGRLKLAYAIEGSRYGTYVLTYFNAEPAALQALDRALSLSDEVLRHTILSAKAGDESKKVELSAYVAPLSEEAREERAPDRRPAPPRAAAPVSAVAAAVKPAEPAMSIEELDKKLDEILDSDISKGV